MNESETTPGPLRRATNRNTRVDGDSAKNGHWKRFNRESEPEELDDPLKFSRAILDDRSVPWPTAAYHIRNGHALKPIQLKLTTSTADIALK